ncbi:MAG: rod shape-determining protein MreD [Clostridia bacterium]|nr:rod shape-determining protein MreD [Clostridia bacterium]
MRKALAVLLILVAVGLDCTIMPRIAIFSASARLTLCVIVAISALTGPVNGVICGFLAGILLDMLFPPVRGFYAIIFVSIGYLSGWLYERSMQEGVVAFGFFAAGMHVAMEVIGLVLYAVIGFKIGNVLIFLLRYVLPSAVLSGLVGMVVFLFLRWILSTLFMRRGRNVGF